MLNNVMKGMPKNISGNLGKFWDLFNQESNAGKLSAISLIPQPYKDIKELGEESKNAISALPKILPAKEKTVKSEIKISEWEYSPLEILSDTYYKDIFTKLILDDYVSEIFMYFSMQNIIKVLIKKFPPF